MPIQTTLSIIICTHNRSEILFECLQSFESQLIKYKNKVELLVIDNASTDQTKAVVKAFEQQQDGSIGYVYEPNIGLSFARNLGLRHANSPYILYIDDDALASSNLIDTVFETLQSNRFACVGGRYVAWFRYGNPRWFEGHWAESVVFRPDFGVLPKGFFVSGGVVLYQKNALESVGGFETDLGMKGKKIAYGEEVLLQNKLQKKGFDVGYNPKMVIRHLVPKHKLKLGWQLQSAFAKGRDSWAMQQQQGNWLLCLKICLKLVVDVFLCSFVALSKYITLKNYYWQNAVFHFLQPLAYGLGRLKGILLP